MKQSGMTTACLLITAVYIFQGCRNDHNLNDTGQNDLSGAQWITDNRKLPPDDSLLYGDIPAPLFRKEFTVKQDADSVILYITAAGYYNSAINGKKTGNNYLDPAWTNYSKRVYYSSYDVTRDVHPGKNCIGIALGNGFYNPLPMKMWGTYNLRKALPTGKPQFIAVIKIVYKDGSAETIKTDRTWKYSYGPVLRNNVYLGEIYNAELEKPGWDLQGFNDAGWKSAVRSAGPGGKTIKAFFPAVTAREIIKPAGISSPGNGIFIADMGANFTGLYRIRLKGKPGDRITFRFGERIYQDGRLNPMTAVCGQIKRRGVGGPGSPDIAWQTDSYIFGDQQEVYYSPVFTYHVYRYMEISGLGYQPEISDIEGIALNTSVQNSNHFECSSDLLNSIQEAAYRTFLNNLVSVQSDCPGREKFGYGGDLNATSETFICNFDMLSFYRKTLYDWVDVLNDTAFIDTAPYVGLKYCGLSWESAFITTQYNLLLYYNDTSVVREMYDLDLAWMRKAERFHPTGIVEKGLGDHESMIRVPVRLTGTSHYLWCARIMKRFAAIMNDTVNEARFGKLAEDINKSLQDMYWRRSVPDTLNRQTLFATLLYYHTVPENEIDRATDSLLAALKKAPSSHFTTGIFGTKYILEALSSAGKAAEVFNVVNSTAFPGWGYMISRGATTIWETWKESDNTYSNCHPMFGTVSEWFYRWLGGIRPDADHPGFRKFLVAPHLPEGLDYVKCSYLSPYGLIRSDWEKSDKETRFMITVPQNTTGTFLVPDPSKGIVSITNTETREVIRKEISRQSCSIDLNGGSYLITY